MTSFNKHTATRIRTLASTRGVLPLTALLAIHLWVSSASVGSRDVYDHRVALLHGAPWRGMVEVLLVLAPLAYVAVIGVQHARRPIERGDAHLSRLASALYRLSGVIVFVFIAAHLWEFRAQTWFRGLPVSRYSTKLAEDLSTTAFGIPWIAIGYLVGSAATFFYISYTFESAWANWNSRFQSASNPRARNARRAFRALAVVGFSVSSAIVLQLATGSRYFATEDPLSSKFECGADANTPKPPTRIPSSITNAIPGGSAR